MGSLTKFTDLYEIIVVYIHLDNSLEDLDFTNCENLKSLGYLLDGFSEGYFIVSGNRSLLKKLYQCEDLSKSAREAALSAHNNYTTHQSFYNKIPYKIFITAETYEINNDEKKWILDIAKIKPGFLSKGILVLAENINDSIFLNYTAKHYQIKNSKKFPQLKISNHFQGGGGDTITGELKNQLDKKQEFIFCFKDSDRFSPHCNISVNAKKCNELVMTNSWLAFFSNTDCREAENLIPEKLLEYTPHIPFEKLKMLRDLGKQSSLYFYSYIDIKQGLTKKFFTSLNKNSPKGKYWLSVMNFLDEKKILKDCELDHEGKCKIHTQLTEKNCVLLDAGNEKTLDHVINFLKEESLHKSFEIIKNDPTNIEWLNIGETVFWLSCALPKIRLS
ncbi:TPA: hypothetical protein ACVB7W_002789 [Acinetobacter baumannii]|nr:hypothetical protein [Acinetobacter baumannii]HAV5030021.1 hypothetical protein [Acinetobacter baumannii]